MFRLKTGGLPADPSYPHDLDKLGYSINADDQIRNTQFPTDPYRYKICKNERYNIVYREAFNQSVRTEVLNRLDKLDVKPFYLPQLTINKPDGAPSVPILMTPPERLKRCSMVIIINNSHREDLGIWSYRAATNIGTVDDGSAVGIVKEILRRAPAREHIPGFIFLNPGQLLYSYKAGRSMTQNSWDAQTRASGIHEQAPLHELNYIGGNKDAAEHLDFVFKHVIQNPDLISKTAKLYCIGREDGGAEMANYLARNWYEYSARTLGLALAQPGVLEPGEKGFATFLRDRTMVWSVSHFPLNTPLCNADPEQSSSYHCRSSGEAEWAEAVIPSSYTAMLDWFEEIGEAQREGCNYRNKKMGLPEELVREMEQLRESLKPTSADWEVPEEIQRDPAYIAAAESAFRGKGQAA